MQKDRISRGPPLGLKHYLLRGNPLPSPTRDEAERTFADLPVDFGALVQDIVPGSPAARAGLQGGKRLAVLGNVQFLIEGDIIVSIDDEKITDDGKLASILLKKKVGQRIKIGLYREDRYMELSTVLTERDDSLF